MLIYLFDIVHTSVFKRRTDEWWLVNTNSLHIIFKTWWLQHKFYYNTSMSLFNTLDLTHWAAWGDFLLTWKHKYYLPTGGNCVVFGDSTGTRGKVLINGVKPGGVNVAWTLIFCFQDNSKSPHADQWPYLISFILYVEEHEEICC